MVQSASTARSVASDLWISSDVLSGIDTLALDLGVELEPHLRHADIELGMVASGRGFLPFDAVCTLLESIAASENVPDFGYRLGLAQRPLQYGIISQLPAISANVGDAFGNFIRFEKLYSQSSHWELRRDGDFAFMRRHDVAKTSRASPQLIVLSITLALNSARAIIGPDWHPAGVYFSFEDLSFADAMRRNFATPVFFNSAHNEIAMTIDELDRPIATSNPALLTVLTRHFEQLLQAVPDPNDLTSIVYHHIRSNLGDQRCNLDWIANTLHVHPRTLQRLLDQEGTSFRMLLQEARLELADYLLRLTRTPISDISALLGYSNLSGFSRAFERARGHSPMIERKLTQAVPRQ